MFTCLTVLSLKKVWWGAASVNLSVLPASAGDAVVEYCAAEYCNRQQYGNRRPNRLAAIKDNIDDPGWPSTVLYVVAGKTNKAYECDCMHVILTTT